MSECSWSGGDVSDADGESSGIRDCPTPTESSTAASDHSMLACAAPRRYYD
eukprot:CAMPEP_0113846906 /NCGR_PEP_ID=MMETSP0372-20130328/1568_1 /TAXON_ID=340204 /ORGANISM="Lankesteria abbotti" /LENGTH=50 /DNA_ID=CAMNT_0000816103 /DNA_START=223 /DNA_END=375 /DNA_ORIENTATION=+ /assembly_acc=CAM_ASM_000359